VDDLGKASPRVAMSGSLLNPDRIAGGIETFVRSRTLLHFAVVVVETRLCGVGAAQLKFHAILRVSLPWYTPRTKTRYRFLDARRLYIVLDVCNIRLHYIDHIVQDFETNERRSHLSSSRFPLFLCPSHTLYQISSRDYQRYTTTVMDFSKNSARQISIIDNLEAINISQVQRKAPPKKKKQVGGVSASTPQNGGGTKLERVKEPKLTKKANKPAARRFYKKNGLKVPLLDKKGKKKPYARLSSSLSNKGTDFLLAIVEAYAGKETRREFAEGARNKAEIADWIEAKETIALGPNPRSTLKRKLNVVLCF
jgi:hypothetical protein